MLSRESVFTSSHRCWACGSLSYIEICETYAIQYNLKGIRIAPLLLCQHCKAIFEPLYYQRDTAIHKKSCNMTVYSYQMQQPIVVCATRTMDNTDEADYCRPFEHHKHNGFGWY